MNNFINTTGYLNNSSNRYNPFNVIKSKNITMSGVDIPLLLRPNKGKPRIAMPNSGSYNFPMADYVVETPLQLQNGGYFDKTGQHYDLSSLINSESTIPGLAEFLRKRQLGLSTNPFKSTGNEGTASNPMKESINSFSTLQQQSGSGEQTGIGENITQNSGMELKRQFGTPNIPNIIGANLLSFGLATVANNIEQGRQKAVMMKQMNNPLFNGTYSFAQNDYGVDPYEQTGQLRPTFAYGGIHINPANKGKFNALKKRTGKSTEELTHSSNPLTRKRAIFAQNAKKWHHQSGGLVQSQEQLNAINQLAKRQSIQFGADLNPENVYSAKKIGDPLPIITYKGIPPPSYSNLLTKLPQGYTIDDVLMDGNNPYIINQDGDVVNLSGNIFAGTKGRKPNYKKGGLTETQYTKQRGLVDANNHGEFDNMSPNDARQILHNKMVNGHPLTPEQYKLFGYLSKGNTLKFQQGGKFNPIDYLYGDDEDVVDTPKQDNTKAKAKRITEEDIDNGDDEMINEILNMDSPYKRIRGNSNSSSAIGPKRGGSKNNYGNIMTASGQYRNFATPEEGKAALINQLNLYQTGKTRTGVKPTHTLEEAMNVYASDGGKSYPAFVAKKLGVSVNTPIKDIDINKWAEAIAKFEGNTNVDKKYKQGGEFVVDFKTMMELKKQGIKFKMLD